MFQLQKWRKICWIYFFSMFLLNLLLPEWCGKENGLIENFQLVLLLAGGLFCKRNLTASPPQVVRIRHLWRAGCIYFFLLFMREISWGRALITMSDGSHISYDQMGLYGKLVHPLVAVLILLLLIYTYRSHFWQLLHFKHIPIDLFILMLLFIAFAYIGERTVFPYFHGELAEELAETGAYLLMNVLLIYVSSKIQPH